MLEIEVFGSKCTVLKEVHVTLLGLFGVRALSRRPHSDSAPGGLCPYFAPRYAHAFDFNFPKDFVYKSLQYW